MQKKIDARDIELLEPMWRRVALTVVVAIWCATEWYFGDQFWGFLTLAAVAYLIWKLFIAFPNADEIAAWRAENQKKAEAPKTDEKTPDAS